MRTITHVAFTIPDNLFAGFGPDLPDAERHWVAELPGVVADLTERWSLRLDEPYQPGGQCSWVAPARDPAGRELVLKVGWRHVEALHEAEGLALWAGDGAVRVHAADAFGQTSALLLERCLPGTPLKQALPEPEQDPVVAGLLRRLWREPPADGRFRSLRIMCAEWADTFEADLTAVPGRIDPGLARAGAALFRELPTTADRQVVLCTDLHGDNILSAQREPWLVVDPKPHVGDPTYDALQHMLNRERLDHNPADLVRRMADLLDLDRDRLARWLFARCVVESIHNPILRQVALAMAPA